MIKKNIKRKYLVESFFINTIIFLIFVGILSFKVFPKILSYEKEKENLFSSYEELQRIEKEGIGYEDFLSIGSKEVKNNNYLENLVKILSKDFYEENIKNKARE